MGGEQTRVMDTRTLVSVYEVDDTGATGRRVGSASLVQPELVVVHPPLCYRLAGADPAPVRLRVGIVSLPDAGGVEVIDTRGTNVAAAADTGSTAPPLVALDLARPSKAPVESLPAGDDLADVLRAHLAGVPEQPRWPPRPEPRRAPWCTLWPDSWLCA